MAEHQEDNTCESGVSESQESRDKRQQLLKSQWLRKIWNSVLSSETENIQNKTPEA